MKLSIILLVTSFFCTSLSCTKKREQVTVDAPATTLQLTDSIIAPTYDCKYMEWLKPIDSCVVPIDINGLFLDQIYPREELIKSLGRPTASSDDLDDSGYLKLLYKSGVHNSMIDYSNWRGIYDFFLYDSRFAIYNGLISVGKPISLFKTLGGGLLIGKSGNYTFFSNPDWTKDVFWIETDKRGIITCISFYQWNPSGELEEDEM